MKKIRLEVEGLRVESFETVTGAGRAGVRAHNSWPGGGSCLETCDCLPTQGVSACPDQCSHYDGCSVQGTCNYSCRSEPCVCVPQG